MAIRLPSIQRRGAWPPAAVFIPLLALSGAALLTAGCRTEPPREVQIAPGVTFRRDTKAGVQLLDVDLAEAHVRPVVVAEHVENRGGNYVGDARTVPEWAEAYHALGGINGGFFGNTYDQLGRRKQIVQLAVVKGSVLAPGSAVLASGSGERYVRSAVGFTAQGAPDIVWGTGNAPMGPRRRSSPDGIESSIPWAVRWAVAAGPRLFAAGVRRVTDTEEHLRMPGRLPRAFIAYDRESGHPRHLLLGRADGMEFQQVADYLTDYFAAAHGSTPREALCMDGGPSAQLVYRDPQSGAVIDAEPTGVQVPTAILLLPADTTR